MTKNKEILVSRRFQRSIRIDEDLYSKGALLDYVAIPSSIDALKRIVEQFASSSQRAFTWTGPYGGGKSSLALLFSAIVNPASPNALDLGEILTAADQKFFQTHIAPSSKGWLVVPVVGGRNAPETALALALKIAVHKRWGTRPPKAIHDALAMSSKDVISAIEMVGEVVNKTGDGVLILCDEMGKFLEYIARENDDLIFFQNLAERISRKKAPILFVGILHQAFERYAKDLGREVQDEWAKIQGRYVDVPLATAVDEVVSLISRAIEGPKGSSGYLRSVSDVISSAEKRRPGTSKSLEKSLKSCYPLHPIVAILLAPISRRRFGQNERSTFGFLSSGEPGAFQDFLKRGRSKDNDVYSPWHLWDYLELNLEPAILSSPDSHKWSVASEAISRCGANGAELHIRLAKTIALIHLFGGAISLYADEVLLRSCFGDLPSKEFGGALEYLERASVIRRKKHLNAWSVFEGSDFDIEEALSAASERFRIAGADLIGDLSTIPPIIAKRHYHLTGTLRWFNTVVTSSTELQSTLDIKNTNGATGAFYLVVSTDGEDKKKAKDICRRVSKIQREEPFAIGFAPSGWLIRTEAEELAALEYIQKHEKTLEGDRVARKEVRARIATSLQRLNDLVRDSFSEAIWYVDGRANSGTGPAAISQLASEICDTEYKWAPIIKNELINRQKPSSAAVGARRELLYRMVTHGHLPHLGFETFPPERALYASILMASGIHQAIDDVGTYKFGTPGGTDLSQSYKNMWDALEEFVRGSKDASRPLSEAYSILNSGNFGLKDGVIPVLLMACLLAMENDIVIYADEMFHPVIDDRVVDRMLQDPKSITVRWFETTGVSRQTLGKLHGITTQMTGASLSQEALPIVKELVAFGYSLQPWMRRTQLVSPSAISVRRILLDPTDPHQMLFKDLPKACGVNLDLSASDVSTSKQVDTYIAKLSSALSELRTAYATKMEGINQLFLEALDASEKGSEVICERAKSICGLSGELRLEGFAAHVSEYNGSTEWLEGMAGLATNKPVPGWVDSDLDEAALEISDLCTRFRRVEAYAETLGRPQGAQALTLVIGTGAKTNALMRTVNISPGHEGEIDQLVKNLLKGISDTKVDDELLLAAIAKVGSQVISRLDPEGTLGDQKTISKATAQDDLRQKKWRH